MKKIALFIMICLPALCFSQVKKFKKTYNNIGLIATYDNIFDKKLADTKSVFQLGLSFNKVKKRVKYHPAIFHSLGAQMDLTKEKNISAYYYRMFLTGGDGVKLILGLKYKMNLDDNTANLIQPVVGLSLGEGYITYSIQVKQGDTEFKTFNQLVSFHINFPLLSFR